MASLASLGDLSDELLIAICLQLGYNIRLAACTCRKLEGSASKAAPFKYVLSKYGIELSPTKEPRFFLSVNMASIDTVNN